MPRTPRPRRRLPPALLALACALAWPIPARSAAAAEVALRVDGLACPFCAYGIEKKVLDVEGVASVHVQLDEGLVIAALGEGAAFDPGAFARAVDDAGFTLRATFLEGAVGTLQRSRDGAIRFRGADPRCELRLRFADDTAPPAPAGSEPLRVAVTGEIEDASREPFALRVHEIRMLTGSASPLRGDPR